MHRRWTCSPNEELEKWVGGCTFFFSFGALRAGLLDTFQNPPRIAWAGDGAARLSHAHCPPTPSTALLLCANLRQLHPTAMLRNCYKSQASEHQHELPLSSLPPGMELSGAHSREEV